MFSGLGVPSYGAHSIRAPGFQTSRISLRLQDKCASRHRNGSLSHRGHLGRVSSLGGLLAHHLPKITCAGHLCASHTASVVLSEDEQPTPVPEHFHVLKVLGLVVGFLIFLASCKCVANASVQKASSMLTFYMRWIALVFYSLCVILHSLLSYAGGCGLNIVHLGN